MYNIIRVYRPDLNKSSRIVKRNVSLEQAQKHCSDPKTSGETWFDAYTKK
jgi:hypothetical protein